MAWLQSSFTNHQLLGESGGSNQRKGYKSGSNNKNTDPDKSDTPLLHDTSLLSPERESANSDWFGNAGSVPTKKQNILQSITSKSSFLSTSLFDRSGISSKPKSLARSQDSAKNVTKLVNKPNEDNKLINEKQNSDVKFEGEPFDYEDESDDDDWCIPATSGGYQRVRPGAD